MKTLITILMLCAVLTGASQIPNGNFETWVNSGASGLLPEGWTSDNTVELQTVAQDKDAYEGNYAMKVIAVPIGVGDYGYASTTFPIDYIPASLNFYVKSAVEFGGVQVEISFYNGESLFQTFSWFSSEDLTEWTPISVPLTQNEPVLTHATIQVIAQVGDLVPGMASISVDAMALGKPLGSRNINADMGALFPNPTSGEVNFGSDLTAETAKVYNASGRLMRTVQIKPGVSSLSLNDLPAGEYIIRFEGTEGKYLHSGRVVLLD